MKCSHCCKLIGKGARVVTLTFGFRAEEGIRPLTEPELVVHKACYYKNTTAPHSVLAAIKAVAAKTAKRKKLHAEAQDKPAAE